MEHDEDSDVQDNDDPYIDGLVELVAEHKEPGQVLSWAEIEVVLGAEKNSNVFRRRLTHARKKLHRLNIEMDGGGGARGSGLRKMGADALFEKTGRRMRSISQAAKRTINTCAVASAHCKSNTEIMTIAARSFVASSIIDQTTEAAVRRQAEKEHARPMTPKEIWESRRK